MRASCQSDYETIKVFEHPPPEIVNGPVVFIGYNEIKYFNWNFNIVNNARAKRETIKIYNPTTALISPTKNWV